MVRRDESSERRLSLPPASGRFHANAEIAFVEVRQTQAGIHSVPAFLFQLAQFVDALRMDEQDQMPGELLVHVSDRFECKVDVMEVWELVELMAGGDSDLTNIPSMRY